MSGGAALVVVVQATKMRDFDNLAGSWPLDGTGDRRVFAEPEVCSNRVVAGQV